MIIVMRFLKRSSVMARVKIKNMIIVEKLHRNCRAAVSGKEPDGVNNSFTGAVLPGRHKQKIKVMPFDLRVVFFRDGNPEISYQRKVFRRNCAGAVQVNNVRAVSYTHLDVYKRQLRCRYLHRQFPA